MDQKNIIEKENIVELVRNKIASEEAIYDLAELFKVFGDTTRAKILSSRTSRQLNIFALVVSPKTLNSSAKS